MNHRTRTYRPFLLLPCHLCKDEEYRLCDMPNRCQCHLNKKTKHPPITTYTLSFYSTRYTFSAKEKDEITGYSYFGARHYHPTLSIWLSVDPMSDKYPSMSPYTYCANNPVRLVDPDGRDVNPIFSTSGELLGTDSKGWKGMAIVMDKKDFKEGMSHEDALKKGTELDNYGKGIKISDSDWKRVEENGGERMTPSVKNNSDKDIYFKPEKTICNKSLLQT